MYLFSVIGFKTSNSEFAEVSEHDIYDNISDAMKRANELRSFYRVDIWKKDIQGPGCHRSTPIIEYRYGRELVR